MSSSTVTTSPAPAREPIAPWWHTLLVLLPIAIGSVASWYQHGLPNAHIPGLSSRLSSFVTVLAEEWLVILVIWLGLRHRGIPLSRLIGGRWQTRRDFFRDLGLAITFLVLTVPLVGFLAHLVGGNAAGSLANTPRTLPELVIFLVLAISGGFGEEVTFRGYLTRQLTTWTGSSVFGVIAQGVLFGLAHGYYGRVMVVIMLHGSFLGLLAHWRKSLRPGMIAHGVEDVIGGIAAFFS